MTIHSADDGDRPVDDDVLPEDPDDVVVADDERPVVLDDELNAPLEGQGGDDAYPEYADGDEPDQED